MKQQLSRKIAFVRHILEQRDFAAVGSMLRRRAWSTEISLGLSRDLTVPFQAPEALVPIVVRPIEPRDVRTLLDDEEPGISGEERRDRRSRRYLLDSKFSSCFVATSADGDEPRYIQWLISPRENPLIQSTFNGLFPQLEANEMLLEGAYTLPGSRGQKIMPAAMALIAEKAADLGATRAITFVGEDNIPSLKGCKRAGFSPYLQRKATHRLGYRRVEFSPLPAGTPYSFELRLGEALG